MLQANFSFWACSLTLTGQIGLYTVFFICYFSYKITLIETYPLPRFYLAQHSSGKLKLCQNLQPLVPPPTPLKRNMVNQSAPSSEGILFPLALDWIKLKLPHSGWKSDSSMPRILYLPTVTKSTGWIELYKNEKYDRNNTMLLHKVVDYLQRWYGVGTRRSPFSSWSSISNGKYRLWNMTQTKSLYAKKKRILYRRGKVSWHCTQVFVVPDLQAQYNQHLSKRNTQIWAAKHPDPVG